MASHQMNFPSGVVDRPPSLNWPASARSRRAARIPADLRLVEAIALRVDESGLTGECAPEVMLGRCTSLRTSRGSVPLTGSARAAALDAAKRLAGDGLRVLALAERELTSLDDAADVDRLERELTFVGLVGLDDPLRPGVRAVRR